MAGTSAGAKKGWANRRRGGGKGPSKTGNISLIKSKRIGYRGEKIKAKTGSLHSKLEASSGRYARKKSKK